MNLNSWNKASSLYRQRFMDPGIYQEGYDTLLNLLNERHSSLLDVACGPGNISAYLHQRHHFAKIVCTDFADNMLKELKFSLPEAEGLVLDCRELYRAEGTFDVITCGFALPYLVKKDAEVLLDTLMLKINPEGFVYLSFLDASEALSGPEQGSTGDWCQIFYYPASQIIEHLHRCGFVVLNQWSLPFKYKNDHPILQTILIVSPGAKQGYF